MDNHAHIITINRMRNTVVGTQWAERDKSRPYVVTANDGRLVNPYGC